MSIPTKPASFDSLDVVFPKSVDGHLPSMEEIPEEFDCFSSNKWVKLVAAWFYGGIEIESTTPKPGIDSSAAMRHVGYCLRSWEPKHERKMAGCAYLLSLWFEDIKWSRKTATESTAHGR